jgi:hypothetical protein
VDGIVRAVRNPLVRTFWRLGYLCVGLSPLLLLLAAALVTTTRAPLAPSLLVLAAVPALFVAAELRGRRLTRRYFRETLFLASRRPARCFACRHDRAGVTASRCPGCGAALGGES